MNRNFADTLQYLYGLLPAYQRQGPAAMKKDLGNIEKLCWALGLPQWHFPSIHVAGTNGKGSVASMLFSILKESGYKTGLYTSPHLSSFTERIRVGRSNISEREVVRFVEKYREIIEAIQPSFFELTVAMAFDHFSEKGVEMAVVEVGLGGRLDSTNIISPELSIITNVSFDHQALLGNTIEAIAAEKAGIIKKLTPVIIGETDLDTELVFLQKAQEMEAPIRFADQTYRVSRLDGTWNEQTLVATDNDDESREFRLDLVGDYQLQNLAAVLTAVEQLRDEGWDISDRALNRGLAKTALNAGLRGRMELLEEEPLVLSDTAHNIAGVRTVMRQLQQICSGKLHIVWGMVQDKDHSAILGVLPKDARYYFTKPDLPRGLDTAALMAKAQAFGLQGQAYDSVADALQHAKQQAVAEDLIFVGGSMFVVAEAIPAVEDREPVLT